uniref:uncharacterized protein LOC120337767 isoform X1 n=1 Tax=Styela clava TaxID=7725 RepID=UPI00193ADCF3|nr:uncharacterized protein LOC120337767 isoform X1 [Styela clava]
MFKYCIFFLLLCIIECVINTKAACRQEFSQWSSWTACSSTCSYGHESRKRTKCNPDTASTGAENEQRFCMLRFCPSYLTWPRMHFYGKLIADVSTRNNIRCNYDTKHFVTAFGSRSDHNWNPDGSGNIYFTDTTVTSLCTAPGTCSTSAQIVSSSLREKSRASLVDVDTDWQRICEIWGLHIVISGILEAKYTRISMGKMKSRTKKVDGDAASSVNFKTKLTNIKWLNNYYKNMFYNASELSMSFVFDLYQFKDKSGRISGTIGMTSLDDPLQTVATRVMRADGWKKVGFAPFVVHYDKKYLVLDISNSIECEENGKFGPVKNLDLAVRVKLKEYCKYYWHIKSCWSPYNSDSEIIIYLTKNGEISKRINSGQDWYETFAGIMDISLMNVDAKMMEILKYNQLMLVERSNTKKRSFRIVLRESEFGLHVGPVERAVFRLNVGQSETLKLFVSKFGAPSPSIHVEMNTFTYFNKDGDNCPFYCNRTIGWPKEVLSIQSFHEAPLTNSAGIVSFVLKAVQNPRFPRRCGLDGQVYPIQILIRYKSKSKSYVFEEGARPGNLFPNIDFTSFPIATLVFGEVENIDCPRWEDVKDIFQLYYNLYPVMWKNNIIDMNSFEDVKSKAHMLKMSMFEFDMENSRYMPRQRDLSYSKRRLVWNWMKCGMRKGSLSIREERTMNLCTGASLQKKVEELKQDIQNAIFAEISVIPPYLTAWLSIKWSRGRNREVADILKEILHDEMRHMTLATNILNSIGGKPDFTTNPPAYPSTIGMGSFYGLDKGHVLSLGPVSIGRINDVFSRIEQPANDNGKELMSFFVILWKVVLAVEKYEGMESTTEKSLLQAVRKLHQHTNKLKANKTCIFENQMWKRMKTKQQKIAHIWRLIKKFTGDKLLDIAKQEMHTIGGFYAKLALKLANVEACVKLQKQESGGNSYSKNRIRDRTIFIGNSARQLKSKHWYKRPSTNTEIDCTAEKISRTMGNFPPPDSAHGREALWRFARKENRSMREKSNENCGSVNDLEKAPTTIFEVTNLSSALRSLIEIVYEGGGGSACSPYEELYGNDSTVLSHFYRFQEIVNGRKLIKIPLDKVLPTYQCVNMSRWCTNFHSQWRYCYAGDPITFYEDGVWSISSEGKFNPYVFGTYVQRLDRQFSLIYSRLLRCLEKVFNGNPDQIKICMVEMYELTMVGRELVATNIQHTNNTDGQSVPTHKRGCPTFYYISD